VTADALLVFVTFPDEASARSTVGVLVGERLAACGTILAGAESIYRWQGAIESSAEHLVLLKTATKCYPRLESRLTELHPYDVPECVAVPVSQGLPAYLNWIAESTGDR